MEPKQIDLNDYVLSGGGYMGESYNHKSNPDLMLKLYSTQRAALSLLEYDCACKAYALGIPTPEPGQLVKVADGRTGVLFQRIQGKKSFARAIADEPYRAHEFAQKFALLCKDLHAIKVDTSQLSSTKEKYRRIIQEHPYLTTDQREKVLRFINDIPDTDTALHGDLHFGNVIFRGDQSWFIDLGELGYGYPLLDLGVTMMAVKYTPEAKMRELYHMDKNAAINFWNAFVPAYFGPGRSIDEIEDEIAPYCALRILFVYSKLGFLIPERQPLVDRLFSRE